MNKRILLFVLIVLFVLDISKMAGENFVNKGFLSSPAAQYPQRIISLIPSVTEELYLLQVADTLVGCTTYCVRPEQAKNKEKVGDNLIINIEKILRLKPDLVIVAEYTDFKIIERLKQFKIPVKKYPTPQNFLGLCNSFIDLGKIVGREKTAWKIIKKINLKVQEIRKKVKGKAKVRVFFQLGANPLFAATGISFTNDYIEFAGGINVVKNGGSGIISREQIVTKDPEVILIVNMGIRTKTAESNWRKFAALSAVKNNRIYVVDANKYCLPSPLSFVETLEEVVSLLHPNSAEK